MRIWLAVAVLCAAVRIDAQCSCSSTALVVQAFKWQSEQQEAYRVAVLDSPSWPVVATAVVADGADPTPIRYLVISTICDAYACIAPSQAKKRAVTHSVIGGEYDWSEVGTIGEASSEMGAHAHAGLVSYGAGFVVYWPR